MLRKLKNIMEDNKKLLEEMNKNLEKFSREMPEQMNGFMTFLKEVEKGRKALDRKTKELIAVACAVVKQCEWCIAFHVRKALESGATKEEIMESAWVAVLMGGGPALMYTQLVYKAIEDFS